MSEKWSQRLLVILGISVGSFIGFNISFIIAASFTLFFESIFGTVGYSLGRIIYLVFIYALFFVVKTLKIPVWLKAVVFSMPMISSLILIGVYGYGLSTPIILGLGLIFVGAWAYYMWKNNWDWTYFYALTFVSICAAYVMIAGIDI